MLLVWHMNKFFKNFIGVLQLNLFNSINETNLFTIEELRTLRLREKKIENDKKPENIFLR